MTSATDELRRLLDERGVEWTDGGMFYRTHWVIDGVHHTAFEQDGKLYMQLSIGPLTPEQAIDATLGRGTCENTEQLQLAWSFTCSECGVHSITEGERFSYCPNCGARVVEP